MKVHRLGTVANYLDARRIVRMKKGRLFSHRDIDQMLLTGYRKQLLQGVPDDLDEMEKISPTSTIWTNDLLVYPESFGRFRSGEDVVDEHPGLEGDVKFWMIRAKEMPEEVFGCDGVGLLVDPEEIEIDGERAIVHPREVSIIRPFPQKSSHGLIEDHCIPTEKEIDELLGYPFSRVRFLHRMDRASVRPIGRNFIHGPSLTVVDSYNCANDYRCIIYTT